MDVCVGCYGSQTKSYKLYRIRIRNFSVYYAEINDKVARHEDGPWLWNSVSEAMTQIAKWR